MPHGEPPKSTLWVAVSLVFCCRLGSDYLEDMLYGGPPSSVHLAEAPQGRCYRTMERGYRSHTMEGGCQEDMPLGSLRSPRSWSLNLFLPLEEGCKEDLPLAGPPESTHLAETSRGRCSRGRPGESLRVGFSWAMLWLKAASCTATCHGLPPWTPRGPAVTRNEEERWRSRMLCYFTARTSP